MCFDFDARPPAPPDDLVLAPIAGGAGAELLELASVDGTNSPPRWRGRRRAAAAS